MENYDFYKKILYETTRFIRNNMMKLRNLVQSTSNQYLWKIRLPAVTRIHPTNLNVRLIEVMELTPNSSVNRLDTIFFNTPSNKPVQKTPHSIKFSHEHTETEPNVYDLWIKQINLQ